MKDNWSNEFITLASAQFVRKTKSVTTLSFVEEIFSIDFIIKTGSQMEWNFLSEASPYHYDSVSPSTEQTEE